MRLHIDERVCRSLSLLLSLPVELFDFVQRGPAHSLESVSNVLPCYEVVPTQRNDIRGEAERLSEANLYKKRKKKKDALVCCHSLI